MVHEEVLPVVLHDDDHDEEVSEKVPTKVVDNGHNEYVVVALLVQGKACVCEGVVRRHKWGRWVGGCGDREGRGEQRREADTEATS